MNTFFKKLTDVGKGLFRSSIWYTLFLVILAFYAISTGEIVTFIMLGFILIMLTNIYDKLEEISKKLDPK